MLYTRLVRFSTLFALLLLLATAHSVFAFDPPPGQGLPWGLPTVMPWPTAHPLSVGESWSPAQNIPPAPPVFIPTVIPTPIVVAPPVRSLPVLPASPTPVPMIPIPALVVPQPPVIYVNPAPVAIPTQIIIPSVPSVPVTVGGASPMDALTPSGDWLLLETGASAWYRIGSGGVQMSVYLEMSPVNSNVAMLVFAPGQLDRPIGKGTPAGQDLARLIWSGGHWNSQGDWYAQVINYNPMAVQYRLTSNARDISNKTCHSYWESINGAPVYWTICE